MEYLVSVDDGAGHRFLAKRDDGRGLLTSANCADCCGGAPPDCPTLRRYNRCPSRPDIEGCQTDPDHVWLCNHDDPPMPGTIKFLNSCYARTDTIIATPDIPAGDVLVPGTLPDVPLGCADPSCTYCDQFYRADPCPGQTPENHAVYVPVIRVPPIPPGTDCPGFSMNGLCYTVTPGQTYTLAHINATGGVVYYDGLAPLRCCQCVQGCTENNFAEYYDCGLGNRTINLVCCCSDQWTATVSYSRTVTQIDTTVPGQTIITTQHEGGQVTVTSQNPTIPQVPGYWLTTINGQQTYYATYQTGVPGFNACPEGPAAIPPPPAPGFCPSGGPWIRGNVATGEYEQVVRSDSYATCNTGGINYLWRYYAAGQSQPRLEHAYNWSVIVRHTGRCGGGCGQSTGRTDPSGRLLASATGTLAAAPLAAQPYAQWPRWAKAIAKFKRSQDAGVGSTVRRVIGDTASGAFKAWYKAVFGQDCGCTGRQELWDRMYPYEAKP